jgi:hypothetical protein
MARPLIYPLVDQLHGKTSYQKVAFREVVWGCGKEDRLWNQSFKNDSFCNFSSM